MRFTGWLLILCCVSTLHVVAIDAPAQTPKVVRKPSPKQDEKRENEAVKEAQQDLQEARDRLKEAEQSLKDELERHRKAIAAHKTAGTAIEKVQDRLEAEHGERTGLTAARKALKEVQTEFDRAAKPILERVHADQKPLVDSLEKARLALKPKEDHPDADRSAAVAEHAKLTKQLRDYEQAAVEADPATKPLRKRLDAAEAAVQAALKKFEAAVERDGDLKAARKEFDQSKREVDAAETAIAKAQKSLADARNRVAQASQKLQQKQAADLKDANRPKRNKGK